MKKTLRMFVAIFCGMNIFAACTSDSDNNTSKPRERVITFEGIENSRDMGGLVMQDGRTICFDRLVRSGNLSTATDADVAIHMKKEVWTIASFRGGESAPLHYYMKSFVPCFVEF